MSPRIVNCLRNECGIKNKHVLIGDVVRYSEKELLRLPNFYLKSLKELKWHLNEIGLFLGMELSKSQLEKLEQFRKAYENEL
jgi:DNA-directed RNA polymerase alpha subunit